MECVGEITPLMRRAMDHILVVDDDSNIRNLLGDYLRTMGYQVSDARDGAQMRRVLNQSHVDLIVMDLMLQGEDGLDLTRELRVGHDVPIIILSARGGLLDRILGLEMGADDYCPSLSIHASLSQRSRSSCAALARCQGHRRRITIRSSRLPDGASIHT